MSQVNVINVIAHNSKSPFGSQISFEIFFEALQPLRHSNSLLFDALLKHIILNIGLTWRIVYIGQASNPAYDQILEEAEMDNIMPGQMKFLFEVSHPYPKYSLFIQGNSPDPG
jgi:hypothetical protein